MGELRKELAELQKCSAELEDEVELNTAAHQEHVHELEVRDGREDGLRRITRYGGPGI